MTKKSVLIPIANGSEEIEAVTLINTLRRAGLEVTVAGLETLQITGSRQIKLVADKLLQDCLTQTFDLIALPGGAEGACALSEHPPLIKLLKAQQQAGRYYAAICASPAVVFAKHGLIEGLRATCYPSMLSELSKMGGKPLTENVVVDGLCITSSAPATALEFSLKLVELLCGQTKAEEVAEAMLSKTNF